jgi:hypothetical protein
VAPVAGLVAHGGLWGAIGEGVVALAVVGVLVAVWLRERGRDDEHEGGLNDDAGR